jgi:hypothetical protein
MAAGAVRLLPPLVPLARTSGESEQTRRPMIRELSESSHCEMCTRHIQIRAAVTLGDARPRQTEFYFQEKRLSEAIRRSLEPME